MLSGSPKVPSATPPYSAILSTLQKGINAYSELDGNGQMILHVLTPIDKFVKIAVSARCVFSREMKNLFLLAGPNWPVSGHYVG